MNDGFQRAAVTIAMVFTDRLPYDREAFTESVRAALDQDHADHNHADHDHAARESIRVIVVDDRGPGARLDFLPKDIANAPNLLHLPGTYANRAAMYNAAIDQPPRHQDTKGREYLLILDNAAAQIVLKRSAVGTMVMAAVRNQHAGMIYGDFERVDSDGRSKEVHLLDWHEGRLRDTVDFGLAVLYPVSLLRKIGKFDEQYQAADQYDLRLRVSEKGPCIHIANRFAGSLYSVTAPASSHNVFDYLLADKNAQLEMESAVTAHLKRTGAHLAPGAHIKRVVYDEKEEQRLANCLASVVIPVNNRPEFIGRAIESVQKQTVRNVEVIVVVNGGAGTDRVTADPTADAVRRYMQGGDLFNPTAPPVRLIVVDINNLGLCLNTGIAAANGKFYVQLDSDDRLKPDAIEKLVEVFDADSRVGMVIGSYEVWNLDEKTGNLTRNDDIPTVTHDEWTADNGRNNLLRINGAGAPRAAHIKVIADAGWFGVNDDPACRNYGEDYGLVLRISERYTIGRVLEPIYEVIRHSGGTDHSIDQATVDRNDNAKDHMRLDALTRRKALNKGLASSNK